MKRKVSWLLALLIQATFISATGQEPDILIMAGQKFKLFSNPLEAYFAEFPEKRPKSSVHNTGNWRGYVAYWEIKNNKLILTDITIDISTYDDKGQHRFSDKSVLRNVFPGNDGIVADWYRGNLIIPLGAIRERVLMGYGSLYEKYTILKIINGKLALVKNMNTDGFIKFRKDQYAAFKKTAEYQKAYDELKKGETSQDWDEKTLDQFIFEYFSERFTGMIFDDQIE
jgi:hypothetical protein